MDRHELEIRRSLKNDFALYAARCLKIRTKEGAVAALDMNAAQRFIHEKLEEQRKQTGKIRALILKGRQQGCSTYVAARFYWKVTHRLGVKAFILTHLEEASKNIHQIVRRFHDHCPAAVRPHASVSSSRELLFDKLDSGYRIGTARSQGTGRSDTLQYFHGSEVAYWANAEEHISGVLQAVPDATGTEVILESTSAGAHGLFYTLCAAAMKGQSEYQFIFVPWFWQEEYSRQPSPDFVLSREEEDYKREFSLSDGQMAWRRAKTAELGNIWTFRREYPSTPEEAFHADRHGALWSRAVIAQGRKDKTELPEMKRIVVAVDPAMTSNRHSDETGIIVAGLGADDHGYILEDLSGRHQPAAWAEIVAAAYYRHNADRVVAEVNQGGDLVEHTLRSFDRNVAYKAVRASRGKFARAEPIAALDARGLVHHAGLFIALEDQMCGFDPLNDGKSPDRVDARVWALSELMLSKNLSDGPKLWGG